MEGKTTIEVEDYSGNAIASFVVPKMTMEDITKEIGIDVADEEDDYINNEDNLIRIQFIKRFKEVM